MIDMVVLEIVWLFGLNFTIVVPSIINVDDRLNCFPKVFNSRLVINVWQSHYCPKIPGYQESSTTHIFIKNTPFQLIVWSGCRLENCTQLCAEQLFERMISWIDYFF